MKIVDYTRFLTNEDKVRIHFKKNRGKIEKFIVQYFSLINGRWRSIIRVDTCHPYPHIHTYHLQKKENVVRLEGNNNELFTYHREFVIKNFRKIKDNFTFSK